MDFLDEALHADSAEVEKGMEDGRRFAKAKAFHDGGNTGLTAGYKTGREMGFIAGASKAILRAMDAGRMEESERMRKTATIILSRIAALPVASAGDDSITDQLQLIRVKFRLLAARSGLPLRVPSGVDRSDVSATF